MPLVPRKVAIDHLLDIASDLRLTINGSEKDSPYGGRIAMVNLTDETAKWPFTISDNRVHLPPLHVNFHFWYFLPAQSITLPLGTGVYWLRVKAAAQTTTDEALSPSEPVDVTVTIEPRYQWQKDADGIPSSEPGSGTETIYYSYLLSIQNGAALTDVYNMPTLFVSIT